MHNKSAQQSLDFFLLKQIINSLVLLVLIIISLFWVQWTRWSAAAWSVLSFIIF